MQKRIVRIFLPIYFLLGILSSCQTRKSPETIATDSLSIAGGQVLFQNNCAGCHNFKQDGIGPDLSGITRVDSLTWLRNYIHSPKSIAESGDEHIKKQIAKFHTLMPSFTNLTDEQLNGLIAFLQSMKAHEKEKPDPLAIKDPFPEKIPASNLQVNLKQIAEIPPSSDKEPRTRISKMDWVPGTNSWFVLDQRGILYKLNQSKAFVWLDISKWKPQFKNEPGLATGFGSFAFHPDFVHNRIFYTAHSESAHVKKADFALPDSVQQMLQWVLCEWKITDPKTKVFSGTCRELLRIDMVSQIHGAQEIIFNPLAKSGDEDYGNLYIGVGDGGAVENGYAFLTHHPDHIWGSILRINPSGNNSANSQYGIPRDNPFADNGDPHAIKEIFASGFRNPNRITWTKKGDMIATNIGQANIESINIILKRHEYGWPNREGNFLMHPDGIINHIYPLPPNDSSYHYTYPVAAYDHDEGNAIGGGFEYTGYAVPALRGKYLFGDIPTGRLFYINIADIHPGKTAQIKEWFVSIDSKRKTLQEICGQSRVDLRFARDSQGEMYIFTKPDGKIYQLTDPTKK